MHQGVLLDQDLSLVSSHHLRNLVFLDFFIFVILDALSTLALKRTACLPTLFSLLEFVELLAS